VWPILYQTPSFFIPTYLAVNSLAFCFCILWVFFRAKALNHNQNAALNLSLTAMIGTFIGARLFHIIFERPSFYLLNPSLIFQFWIGGFVFYGGLGMALVLCYLHCRLKGYNFLVYADLFAPVIAAGYAVGRLGCFFAGCCFGRQTDLQWGVVFPSGVEAPPGIPLHPTQIYSSLWEFGVLAALLILERRSEFKNRTGRVFGMWLILHSMGRGLVEQFRGDFRGRAPFNLSISTWLSIVALAAGIYLLGLKRNKNASTTS